MACLFLLCERGLPQKCEDRLPVTEKSFFYPPLFLLLSFSRRIFCPPRIIVSLLTAVHSKRLSTAKTRMHP